MSEARELSEAQRLPRVLARARVLAALAHCLEVVRLLVVAQQEVALEPALEAQQQRQGHGQH